MKRPLFPSGLNRAIKLSGGPKPGAQCSVETRPDLLQSGSLNLFKFWLERFLYGRGWQLLIERLSCQKAGKLPSLAWV